MPRLPARFAAIILAFAPLFLQRSWRHAEMLLIGAILAPGKRTVTSILRITGLSRERHFVNYHRVLSRTRWSGRDKSGLLKDRVDRLAQTAKPRPKLERLGRRCSAQTVCAPPAQAPSHSA
jgi:hypothetical protein